MSSLANQQQNLSFPGLLQVPGGITSTLQQVQDGNGNATGLSLSSTGASVTTSSTFQASKNGTILTGATARLISDGFGDLPTVKDFGAVGNGVTDDTAAFNAAIAATPLGVAIPAGSYKITGTVTGTFYSFGAVTIVTGTVTSIQNLLASGLSTPTGSTLVGTIQSGTGATARTVAAKINDIVSILDFGADPTGVADSTAAMTAAQTASSSVYWPAGTYKVTAIPTLGISWGIGIVNISGVQTYLHPISGPVEVIYASVYNPDTTNTTDASVKLQLAIDFAQNNNLFVQFQENAQYKITTGLIFKQGRSSSDTQRYSVKVYGNNSALYPAASVTAVSIVPRCLLADAGTGRGIAPIYIYDLVFDGTASASTSKAMSIGATGYACDNFGYSVIQNIICVSFNNNSTIAIIEARHVQFNFVVIRGSVFSISASAAGSFCGDLTFQTCEFVAGTSYNLLVNAGNSSTNAQVRGLHFESCVFYGSVTAFASNGVNSQIGDIWFSGCQWDVGTTAVAFDATNSGQIFQIHFIECYIVNYSTRAISVTRATSGSIYQFSINGGGLGIISGANAIFVSAAQDMQINSVQFDSCTSSTDLINIDNCTNVSINNNVATRCSTVPYFMSIGNGSNNYSILGNMANVATAVVNDYTAGSPTRQVVNNLKSV